MSVVINGTGSISGLSNVGGIASAQSGSVIQTVQATYSTGGTTTSTSYVSTGMTATITPTLSTSKILIMASIPVYTPSTATYSVGYTIFRGTISGTDLGAGSYGFLQLLVYAGGVGQFINTSFAANYLDSPATTSATTYTFAAKSEGNLNPAGWCNNSNKATITLLEIAQ